MLSLALATALVAPHVPSTPPLDDLFPPPSAPLILQTPEADAFITVDDLLTRYAELTRQQVELTADTQQLLESRRLHITRDIEVPVEEVQEYVELILIKNEFTLQPLKANGERILWITSLQSAARNNLRSSAIYLPEDSLSVAEHHPAIIFQTVVELPHCDVRQVSNSMRTMITDANTQQMLPAGDTASMILVGFGPGLWDIARSLFEIDERAAQRERDLEVGLEVIALENGDAAALATLLTEILPQKEGQASGPQVRADVRTNSLVVSARSNDMAKIKRTIASLDR